MKRIVITGLGIVSSIGNNSEEVLASLQEGRSGITFAEDYQELGFRSHVRGAINIDLDDFIDRKVKRFMGDGAAFNYIAMQQAITDSGLEESDVSNVRTGLIMGSGGPSTSNLVAAADILREKGIKRVGPYMVTRAMSSTNTACLATPFKIKGINYSITSACATSAHCIGNAMEQIQLGKQDIVFAGGGEEVHWTMSVLFDGMGAMSSKYNDTPESASRPYDEARDGFVISGGGGVLVLEELEHAKARGAKIYAELTGYGATSDGYDMVQPSGEGAIRCMQQAMATVDAKVDYINAHGTSTPVGDTRELEALRQVFDAEAMPYITSTKSLTGHALGAAGVNEAIYSLLMMKNNFISASANITSMDPGAEGMPIVATRKDDVTLNTIMSNSFGFGGTNASLIFQRYNS
ncbi:beta-ketoacyl-ACP synthase I [methanotrophic endosymbiont of Bathymodiolus puteoserpentis (Logatchev)]|jgi:3-oxoacyl-[acyl-carrier-protein] synthase-1|uniref:beta-ketoacyl-ACP synthase I n=1 Tax=methanotrophic endosymbiont of Bathymodiolus puteoserpentis (Logatchev) TaxID=343235 RepID=UPI0013CB829D|nr:beta-ketoacyl-ACP synthase I [methanotrophic endosymbiont of Bathymodiolus puteoserpentis (Logatchev)]SHE20752.1 3-oxoacyl-[acyl-carrier-protein] synthase, KASI [methanotrophic endosymbiont of Bathymodiolus puteoserpentis (Logatchev)]